MLKEEEAKKEADKKAWIRKNCCSALFVVMIYGIIYLAGKLISWNRAEMPLFPFVRLVSAKNPLQLSALLMALVVFLLRFGSHQIYQLTLYTHTGYTDGLLVMVLDLFADIFVGVIFYFVALLLLSRFHRKEMGMAGRGE